MKENHPERSFLFDVKMVTAGDLLEKKHGKTSQIRPKLRQGSRAFSREGAPESGVLHSEIILADLNELERNCRALLRRIKSMDHDVCEFLDVIRNWRTRLEAGSACGERDRKRFFELESESRSKLFSDLDVVFRIMNKRPFSAIKQLPFRETDQKLPLENEVFVVVEGTKIYVKTPLLFNRNKHWCGKGFVDYYELFAPAVAKKMWEIEPHLPRYMEKHIHVLSVYPGGTTTLPDADNIDAKKVVDAITSLLPGGDSGSCCTFSSAVICGQDLPPGAYFTVSEGFAAPPDHQENLLHLFRHFGAGN